MAAFTRVKQLVFGGSASSSQFAKIGSQSAGAPVLTKDLAVIQSLSQYLNGLYAITANHVNPPYIEDLNALYLLITSQIAYIFEKGIPEYEAATDYYNLVSFVQVNGVVYQCVNSSPPNGSAPPSAKWRNIDPYTTAQNLATETARALAAEALLAPLASPALTGNPTVPTQSPGTNNTRIASTAYADAAVALATAPSAILTGLKTVDGSGSGLLAEGLQTAAITDFSFNPTSLGMVAGESRLVYGTAPSGDIFSGANFNGVLTLNAAGTVFNLVVRADDNANIRFVATRRYASGSWGTWAYPADKDDFRSTTGTVNRTETALALNVGQESYVQWVCAFTGGGSGTKVLTVQLPATAGTYLVRLEYFIGTVPGVPANIPPGSVSGNLGLYYSAAAGDAQSTTFTISQAMPASGDRAILIFGTIRRLT